MTRLFKLFAITGLLVVILLQSGCVPTGGECGSCGYTICPLGVNLLDLCPLL